MTALQPAEPLTPAEVDQLADAERIIEDGIVTFFKVGMALARVRDGRLYRQGYATFEEYVDRRWNMSRTHAYRLIEAGQVVAAVSPIGDTPEIENEGQARALAPVVKLHGPEAGADVLKEIEGEGEKVTAKKIADRVKSKIKPKAKAKPIPKPPPKAQDAEPVISPEPVDEDEDEDDLPDVIVGTVIGTTDRSLGRGTEVTEGQVVDALTLIVEVFGRGYSIPAGRMPLMRRAYDALSGGIRRHNYLEHELRDAFDEGRIRAGRTCGTDVFYALKDWLTGGGPYDIEGLIVDVGLRNAVVEILNRGDRKALRKPDVAALEQLVALLGEDAS